MYAPWTKKLITCMSSTAIAAGTPPKNPLAIGANVSKAVNVTFDPAKWVNGICNAPKPKIIKKSEKISFCMRNVFMMFIN